jgi:hypothetical protein
MALCGLSSRAVGPELRSGARRAERSSSGRIKPGAAPVVQHGLRVWRANADGRAVAAVKA